MKILRFVLIVALASLSAISNNSWGRTVAKSDLLYLGAFRVPHHPGFANNSFVNAQYQPFTYNPYANTLFLGQYNSGPTDTKGLGEFTVVEPIKPSDVGYDINKLNQAAVVQAPQDISDGNFDRIMKGGEIPGDEAKALLGGLYVYDNKLLGTAWGYYDASSAVSYRSHYTANLKWDQGYGFNGLHAVGLPPVDIVANGGFVGGYMVAVPQTYRTLLGYPMLTGRVGGPIVGRSSFGPTVWGFDPNALNFDDPAPATMFLGYPSDHKTLGDYSDVPSTTFNRSTGVSGVVWPGATDSVLFFGDLGLGVAYDSSGVPLKNDAGECFGPGTSNRVEAKENSVLKTLGVSSWSCGYQVMSKADIDAGLSCCFDPVDASTGRHSNEFVVGNGTSCYGPGTRTLMEARTSEWLQKNTPSGYTCGGYAMSGADIESGNACCFVGTNSTAKGGSSYPSVHQVWQYDAADLVAVKNGVKKPWDIMPLVWNFDLPFGSKVRSSAILGVGFDENSSRLYVAQTFGDGEFPLIHVFELDRNTNRLAKPVILNLNQISQ